MLGFMTRWSQRANEMEVENDKPAAGESEVASLTQSTADGKGNFNV